MFGLKIVSTKSYFEPRSIDRILASFKQILEGESFLTMGKFCRQFEDQFAVYTGTKHAISVSCGTGALEIILNTLGVKGCDVIVPTNTFAATAFAVIRAGGNPVFADCSSDMTLDPKDLKTKGLLVIENGTYKPLVSRYNDTEIHFLPPIQGGAY